MENDFIININDFNLSYGDNQLFSCFNLYVKKGQCVGISGPTGTGKTTLLNKIVKEYIKSYKISYVFQDNKLIDDLTVLKNIMLPVENEVNKKDAEERALYFAGKFDIYNKLNTKVNVLSGGEKQRVNLARAFAYDCNILLMDEPFSAQDDNHRNNIINMIKDFTVERNITTVVVSHNKEDLKRLCSSIIVLD